MCSAPKAPAVPAYPAPPAAPPAPPVPSGDILATLLARARQGSTLQIVREGQQAGNSALTSGADFGREARRRERVAQRVANPAPTIRVAPAAVSLRDFERTMPFLAPRGTALRRKQTVGRTPAPLDVRISTP